MLKFIAKYFPMLGPGEHIMVDMVTGEDVFEFTQIDGKRCMATSRWSWFRVWVDDPDFDDRIM